MASIVIGGEPVEGRLDTFFLLEKAWPHVKAVEAASQTGEQMDAIGAMIAVIAVEEGRPDLVDPVAIKKKLRRSEIAGLLPFFNELLSDSGAASTGSGAV